MVSFGGLNLEHPIMNAAGTAKRLDDVIKLAKSPVAAIMVGSITKQPREGNPGNVWEHLGVYTLNSLGLPNPGADYYWRMLPEMVMHARTAKKPLFLSVAGFTPEEYEELTKLVVQHGADAVELNLGCPNVWGEDGQKPIASFDLDLMEEILQRAWSVVGTTPFGVKLSPYSDPMLIEKVAALINRSKASFVTTSNTFPNAYACDASGKQLIAVSKGLAGLAGPAMKPIALGQLIQFRDLLRKDILSIGAGGITTGQDVIDYLRNGATLVQVASEFARSHSPKAFEGLLMNYLDHPEVTSQ